MIYFLRSLIPIVLLVIGFVMSYHIHKISLSTWAKDFKLRNIATYALPTFAKSLLLMGMMIFIHNSLHDHHYIELTFFILIFAVFSIIQSPYSTMGFISRNRNLIQYAAAFFKEKSERADKFVNRISEIFVTNAVFIMKFLVLLSFLIIFLPNISFFITSNIIFFVALVGLLLFSLLLNNLIYFGLVSIMVFQIDPVSITFTNINYITFILSYITILIGLSFENRLQNKMFFFVTMMEVKRFNFKLGYETLHDKNRVTIYQNMINHYYYVYYRNIGLVTVYDCDFDLNKSKQLKKLLVKEGKSYLLNKKVLN